jgi:hypothetical protein
MMPKQNLTQTQITTINFKTAVKYLKYTFTFSASLNRVLAKHKRINQIPKLNCQHFFSLFHTRLPCR